MPEEWLTYREIGARLGLTVEAVRTRVRRAGWRTQPGNDGRTRVLVSDQVFVEPVRADQEGVNDRVNKTGDLTRLVTLLTAAEARVSRLEGQLEAERDRVNEARSEAARLRVEVAELTARTDRAEQALDSAESRADAAEARAQAAEAGAAEAHQHAREAEDALAAVRRAEEERKARGRWARLRAAWRGA
jgi:chromosome segregation ATPase